MKKGIHPLLRTVRIVMKDGASFTARSTQNRAIPLTLQADTTTHPAWTKEKAGISMEDERMQRLMTRFSGFVPDIAAAGAPPQEAETEAEQEPQQP
jgi:ribosomal protein L31